MISLFLALTPLFPTASFAVGTNDLATALNSQKIAPHSGVFERYQFVQTSRPIRSVRDQKPNGPFNASEVKTVLDYQLTIEPNSRLRVNRTEHTYPVGASEKISHTKYYVSREALEYFNSAAKNLVQGVCTAGVTSEVKSLVMQKIARRVPVPLADSLSDKMLTAYPELELSLPPISSDRFPLELSEYAIVVGSFANSPVFSNFGGRKVSSCPAALKAYFKQWVLRVDADRNPVRRRDHFGKLKGNIHLVASLTPQILAEGNQSMNNYEFYLSDYSSIHQLPVIQKLFADLPRLDDRLPSLTDDDVVFIFERTNSKTVDEEFERLREVFPENSLVAKRKALFYFFAGEILGGLLDRRDVDFTINTKEVWIR